MVETLIPASDRLYHAAFMVGYRTIRGPFHEQPQPFKNTHPLWDCQPWSEGMGIPYGMDVCCQSGDELSSTSSISSRFLKVALWWDNEYVYRFPTRKK